MNITKSLLAAGFIAASVLAPLASAVTLNVNSYIGSWNPASAYNNDSDTTAAANALVNWYNGGTNANTVLPGATFSLANPGLAPLPGSLTFGFRDETAPISSFDNTVYTYVVGKFGNTSYLYYLGNLVAGTYELPSTGPNQNGLSHIVTLTVRNPPTGTPGVPDGGSTVAMLGLALVGIALGLRRRA